MAIYTLTPSQLKGAGVYNSFEIPAGGGSSFASTNSFAFDGTDDYITNTTSPFSLLDGQSKATISAWIKAGSLTSQSYLFAIGGATKTFQCAVRLQSVSVTNVNCYFYINGATNSERSYASLGAIKNDGQWHHLMICMDLVTFSSFDEVDFFLDGNLLTTNGYYNPTSLDNSATALAIGNRENPNTGLMVGSIDEFAIWSGTDLRSEVSAVYNGGIPGDLNNSGLSRSPDLWYRMGENATWTGREFNITDAASTNNGITNNMAESAKTTDVPS